MTDFGKYHPIILFLYYLLVLLFAMFSIHPVVMACVLVGAVFFYAVIHPLKTVWNNIVYYFFLFLLLSITNPIFSHNGETYLFFMNDNPITLEALFYGIVMATMIVGIMFWCKNYNSIMTSDKFVYLFGKAIPRLSLILSMALRFIPLFKQQIGKINKSQKAMGLYSSDSYTDRLMGGMRVFDSLLSWSLENSLETADAMKARGYGLPGRTNFSLFRFHKRDGILLGVIVVLGSIIATALFRGWLNYEFYPMADPIQTNWKYILLYACILVFMCLPALLEIKEKLQWKYLKSKI